MTEYRNIEIGLLEESATNPRKRFNSQGLVELAESLKAVGMIEPLVVRRRGERFEIVAGARRYRAAKLAGLTETPASVRDLTDGEVLEIQLIENLQRADVHPIEEASGYRTLIESAGYDVEKIAAKISKSASYVYQRLKLADLIPPAQTAFYEKDISAGEAILLARLTPAGQKRGLEEIDNGLRGVRALAEWIAREIHRKLNTAPFDLQDAGLVKKAGSCADCPKRSGSNPTLHAGIDRTDVCTDDICYAAKRDAHIVRARKQYQREEKQELLSLQQGHEYFPEAPKDLLMEYQFSVVKPKEKPCTGTRDGIVLRGKDAGKILAVCADPKCKVHHAASTAGSFGDDWKRKQREEAKKLDLARAVRGRLGAAILEALPQEPTAGLLEDWAESMWSRLGSDYQRVVRKRHDWDADTIPVGDMTEAQLCTFLSEMALVPSLWCFSYMSFQKLPEELTERAEILGIDWKAIESEVQKENAAGGRGEKGKRPKSKPTAPIAEPVSANVITVLEAPAPAAPNEYGVMDPKDCEIIDSKLKGCKARILLVRVAEGSWRQAWEMETGERSHGGYPNINADPCPDRYSALGRALSGLMSAAGQPGESKKAKAAGKKILEWARGLAREAVSTHTAGLPFPEEQPEDPGIGGDGPIPIPAPAERQPSAPRALVVKCPVCGLWAPQTPEGLVPAHKLGALDCEGIGQPPASDCGDMAEMELGEIA